MSPVSLNYKLYWYLLWSTNNSNLAHLDKLMKITALHQFRFKVLCFKKKAGQTIKLNYWEIGIILYNTPKERDCSY